MACPTFGKPILYNMENATDSWMQKLNLSNAAVVIMNSGYFCIIFPLKTFGVNSIFHM